MNFIYKISSILFPLLMGATLALFVIGPARFWTTIGIPSETLSKYFASLILGLIVLTTLVGLWKRMLSYPNSDRKIVWERPLYHRWQRLLTTFLCGLLIVQAAVQITSPLDWDEHEHVSVLASDDPFFSMNPFRGSENHSLASVSAFVSMKLFGVNKFSARIPALGFGIGFLLAYCLLAFNFIHPAPSIVTLVALNLNPMVIYSMHQMRGYAPLFCFTIWILYLMLKPFSSAEPSMKRRHYLGFVLCSVGALFSHTFGGLFLFLLFVSTLVFANLNKNHLNLQQKRIINSKLVILSSILFFYSILCVFILLHLQETGFAGSLAPRPGWLVNLMLYRPFTIFGFVRIWEIKLFSLLSFGLILFAIRDLVSKRHGIQSFLLIQFLTTVIFFVAMFFTIRFTVLEGRMLQPFLVPFLWLVFLTINQYKQPATQIFFSLAFLALFSASHHLHPTIPDEVVSFFHDTEAFAQQVKSTISEKEDHCLTVSGDSASAKYYTFFYFHSTRKMDQCKNAFRIHLEKGLFDRFSPVPNDLQSQFSLLVNDTKGRLLFMREPQIQQLSWSQLQ